LILLDDSVLKPWDSKLIHTSQKHFNYIILLIKFRLFTCISKHHYNIKWSQDGYSSFKLQKFMKYHRNIYINQRHCQTSWVLKRAFLQIQIPYTQLHKTSVTIWYWSFSVLCWVISVEKKGFFSSSSSSRCEEKSQQRTDSRGVTTEKEKGESFQKVPSWRGP